MEHGQSVVACLPPAFIFFQAADAEVTNATSSVGDVGGSFSRFTQAAEVFASQAATQAAGLFTYKSTDQSQAYSV